MTKKKMLSRLLILGAATLLLQLFALGQSTKMKAVPEVAEKKSSAFILSAFPELKFTKIPGASQLTSPQLIVGKEELILAEGMGLAAPALWDWNHDGINDLLIGEFGSGIEFGRWVGNFIRVYPNLEYEPEPYLTGKFSYAKAPLELILSGEFNTATPYSVHEDCCIGFTPQFVDIDGDGYQDMITGQYSGFVTWFRGSEIGFLPGQILPQENDSTIWSKGWEKYQYYWVFSSASFGDFTGDGLPDLITGGTSLRISKNIGTKNEPRFGRRQLLMDIKGQPLKVYDGKIEGLESIPDSLRAANYYKISPYVVDWDNDGSLDLLVTNAYADKGVDAVDFFKGVKTDSGYRFQPRVPLFTAKNGGKAFPGSGPRIFVGDYNNDGVNDLLIGASVVTMNGKYNHRLSWEWEHDNGLYGAGKDPGNLKLTGVDEEAIKRTAEVLYKPNLPKGISLDDFMTIRHVGYVYVMLGKKE